MTHVDDLLWDWLLGALDEDESAAVASHLDACDRCRAVLDQEASLLAGPEARPLPKVARERLLADATTLARFEQFADDVASLMDVSVAKANDWLSRLDEPDVWSETAIGAVKLFHLEGGPAVENAVTGFVRLAPNTEFPEHTHLGVERMLVVQGRLRDEAGDVHGPGSLIERPAGMTHVVWAERGVPLVYLSVVQEGVEIFGLKFGPDSPDL